MSVNEDFKSIQDSAQKALVNATKTVNQIASKDLGFFRAANPTGAKRLDKQNQRLLGITKRLLKSATNGTDIIPPRLPDAEAVDDNWQGIVEVIDNLLEKADVALDEYTGVIKKLAPAEQDIPPVPEGAQPTERRTYFGPKPQLQFDRLPTNTENSAFKPLLKSKPHAVVPLKESIQPTVTESSLQEYGHPYEAEISQYRYPDQVYVNSDPIPFKAFTETEAIFVDTPKAVATMLEELKLAKEIAVDLEHHDRHSYVGLVSLMQISTRDKDWIVDTLKPWREDLQVLNEVFANPDIVKVLHGSHSDVIWLQRDLGLYLVGMFDTYHASRALHYQRHSLAWLLSKFANFEAQKQYQMADWRIRPLPQEFLDYARSDTHFLLYIYDMMRNELIEKSRGSQQDSSLLNHVLEESNKECLQRYERQVYDTELGTGSNGWYNMAFKSPAYFTKEQFAVFRAVHRWRDEKARIEDESLGSIMQNQVVFNIATQIPLNTSALLGCISPVTTTVRQKAEELVGVIKEAKSTGARGPETSEIMNNHPSKIAWEKRKAERKEKQRRVAEGPLLAQVIQQERKIVQDTKAVVAKESNFWGSTVNGMKRLQLDSSTKASLPTLDLRLQIPLPPLTAEVYTTQENGAVMRSEPVPVPEHQHSKQRGTPDEDDVLVIKELGRGKKRKAPSHDGEEPDNEDDPEENNEASLTPQKADQGKTKAQRKAERRKKKARKLEAKAKAQEQAKEEAPFDYANAPSVLNAKASKAEKAAAKPAFNPYAKSANAPKGMRKAKKEIAGKSHTFKS